RNGHVGLASGDGRGAMSPSNAALQEQAGTVALLEVNPDLARDLSSEEMRQALGALVVPAVRIHGGRLEFEVCANDKRVVGSLIGLLVIDGVVVREMMLGPHVSAQLCGPGDLLELRSARDQRCFPALATISVPGTAVLALLDDRVLAASRRWPRLAGRLLAQALGQIGDAGAHQTISQLPRVEDRLLALFWHLADRWGRVLPDGVRIDLPLTHETIGRLIGARRPTVTLGLRALRTEGFLERHDDAAWLLARDSWQRLTTANGRTVRGHRSTLPSLADSSD
ncbi:MAG TPA: Crp/Fnr family transcriptional regulator, partial [Solirubrobacteraceae bacterium]|nr:Crp/Fnr family transcriptional regulator [Solirubrobacteraceae bacterium]